MKTVFLLIFIFFVSCNSVKNEITCFEKCINNESQGFALMNTSKKIELLKFFHSIETDFLKSKVLKNQSKESYLKLIDEIESDNKLAANIYQKSNQFIVKSGIIPESYPIIGNFFSYCFNKCESSSEEVKKINVFIEDYTNSDASDNDLLKKLINEMSEESFQKECNRYFILFLIIRELEEV